MRNSGKKIKCDETDLKRENIELKKQIEKLGKYIELDESKLKRENVALRKDTSSLKREAHNQASNVVSLKRKIAELQQVIKAQQSEIDHFTSVLARQEHERSREADRRRESQCEIQIPMERSIPDCEETMLTREEDCDLPEQPVNPPADCEDGGVMETALGIAVTAVGVGISIAALLRR